jgi:hypothetical protein
VTTAAKPFAIALAASLLAAAPAAARPPSAEAQLIQLEQDYAKALIRKDRAFLMRYYAPDWRGGNWLGFWTRSTMLRAVLERRYVIRSMALRDMSVKIIGTVAIVQGVDEEVTMVDGKNTSGKWSFTDVFAHRDGRWVAVASQTSKIGPIGD